MKKLLLLASALFIQFSTNVYSAELCDTLSLSSKESIQDTQYDSLSEQCMDNSLVKDNWVKHLIKNNFNVNDTTLHAPKFVDFCLKVYRWADYAFNTYDTTYVYSIPQKWKFMLKANRKSDQYHFNGNDKTSTLFVNTDPRTSVGFRLSFMAVGFEYMPDIDNLFKGRAIDHRRTRFSFTCSRIFAELYSNKNTGPSHILKYGQYNEGRSVNILVDGLSSNIFGVDAYYVLNHKKYSHAAPYCFSKIQKRSAGSFLLGLNFTNQRLSLDTSEFPEYLKPYNPYGVDVFTFHNYDYAILAGYGYNWVFHRNWVFNVTAMPSIGFKHYVEDTFDGPNNKLALNFRGRLALVYNVKKLFFGLHAELNGFASWSKSYWLYNQITDATLIAGIRF